MRTSLRSASLLAVLAAVPSAHAGLYFFLGNVNPFWNVAANWQGGMLPTGGADFGDEVFLGLGNASGLLTSNMNFGFTRLKTLQFDQRGGVRLSGNAIRLAGGGRIAVTSAAESSMSNALLLNGNAAANRNAEVAVVGGATLTATGAWTGNGGFTKTGGGTLFLINANAYTDGATIREGRVRIGLDGALASANVTLAGGTLDLNGYSPTVASLLLGDGAATNVGALTGAGKLVLGGGLRFIGAPNRATVPVTVASNLFLTSGVHGFGSAANRSSGDYDLVFSGILSGNGGFDKQDGLNMVVTTKATYGGDTEVSGGTLYVGTTDALPTNTALTVGPNGYLSLRTYTAQTGVVADSFAQTVGSLSGSGIVDLGAKGLTVGGSNVDTTFAGNIGDFGLGGWLTKVGTGGLVLSGQNSYTGGTALRGGGLGLGSDNALGGAFGVAGGDLLLAGGRLDLNGFSPTINDLVLGDGAATAVGTIRGPGTLNLTGDVTYRGRSDRTTAPALIPANLRLSAGQHAFGDDGQFSSGQYDQVFSGVISGPGGIDFAGVSYVALTGRNTYAGATLVDGGRLYLGTANALPTSTALAVKGDLRMDPGLAESGVSVGNYSQTVGSLAGPASGTISLGAATLTVGGLNTDTTFAGSLLGDGGNLVKQGTGALTLSGTNAYTGRTTIKAGTIKAGSDAAIGTGDLALLGGTLDLGGFSPTIRNLVLGDGDVRNVGGLTGAGSLALKGGLRFNGAVNHEAFAAPATEPVRISTDLALSAGPHVFSANGTHAGNGIFYIVGEAYAYDVILSGALSDAGGLEVDGGLRLALTGRSTYAGPTRVKDGTLVLGATNVLPATTALTVDGALNLAPSAFQSGVVRGSYSQTVGSLAGAGSLDLGSATLAVGGLNSDTAFSGRILGTGALVMQGTGSLTLSGTNAYSGGTAVNAGTLLLGANDALGTGALDLKAGGTLDVGPFAQTVATLTGAGRVLIDGGGVLKVGNSPSDFAFAGSASGPGLLDKIGAGRFDATGSDFSGLALPVQVDAGILATTTRNPFAVRLNGGTLEIAQDFAGTFDQGRITGNGSFRKSGAGTVKVGDADFAGSTTVAGGGLTLLSGATFSSGGSFAVSDGATVRLSAAGTTLAASSLANAGLLSGSGEVDAPLTNSGRVQVGPADRLVFDREATNLGALQLDGGELDFAGVLTNAAGSFVTGRGVLSAASISQSGTMAFTGATDLHGDVALLSGAKVQTSGGATLTFWDDVAHNGAEIRTNAGAYTTFKGSVGGAGAYTGLGTVEFDGDLHPGNSPASVAFEGDLVLGDANVLTMELGGVRPGTGYDCLSVGRTAYLGGTLSVVEYGGFAVQAGQSFDLFDGTLAGTFSSIRLPRAPLGWDTSGLYTTGTIRAVPEPASLAALAVGALGLLRRRQR